MRRATPAIALLALLACRPPEPAAPEPAPEPAPVTEATPTMTANLHPALRRYVEALLPELDGVSPERRQALDPIARFVIEQREAGEPARLIFICTHNSRRSHMSQLWAATAAAWYGVDAVETFSGGTEATAFRA